MRLGRPQLFGIAASAVGLAASNATAATRTQPRGTTFLVAHGAWSAGWAWRKMHPLMSAAGHRLITPTYTGLGEREHLANPSNDLIFNAPNYNTVTGQKGNCDGGAPWNWPPDCQAFPRFRHTETANVAFFDSHAKGMKKGQLNYGRNVRIEGITF